MGKNNIMHFKTIFTLLTIMVVAVSVAFLSACSSSNGEIAEENPVSRRPVKVMTVTGKDSIEARSFPGIVRATREIDLAFRVGGPLVAYDLKIGETVEKGETIARVDPRDFEIRVQKLSAELKSAEARLADAEKDYERQKNLLVENAASQAQYDKTQLLVDTTRAGIESLKTDLAAAKNTLADTRLTAPFDGVVNRKHAENHETVSPGMPVVSLLDVSKLEIDTAVPEDIIIRESDFAKIYVTLDAHPGIEIAAGLEEMGRQTDNSNQSYPVKAVLEIPDGISVEPGMAASLHLSIRSPEMNGTGIYLPGAAVFADADGRACVWRLTGDMRTEKIEVETGIQQGDTIMIHAGVSAGDQVVSAGARFLLEGQEVRILDGNGGQES